MHAHVSLVDRFLQRDGVDLRGVGLESNVRGLNNRGFIKDFWGIKETSVGSRELWPAPTPATGCAVAPPSPRPLRLSMPGSAGPRATCWCSWQAVVQRAANTTVPGKRYLMGCSCQESCPCRPLVARSLSLVLRCVLPPSCAAGELMRRPFQQARPVHCGTPP